MKKSLAASQECHTFTSDEQDGVETDDEMSTDACAEAEGNDIATTTSAVPSESTGTSASDNVYLATHI